MHDEQERTGDAGLPPTNASEASGDACVKPHTPSGGPPDDVLVGEEMPSDRGFDEAAYLDKIAKGELPFDLLAGNEPGKYTYYARAMSGYLAKLLHCERKAVVTLALAHFARSFTHAPTTTTNDLAVLVQGMQFVVEDLALEVVELNQLALRIHVQEATVANPSQPL